MMAAAKQHLVVDTAAFLRLKQLDRYEYENVHVTPGVVSEIRDHVARHNLQFSLVIPKVTEPTEQDIATVRRCAKATKDLGFLSETDIQVLALTYMLQRLTGDVEFLKLSPDTAVARTVEQDDGTAHFLWATPSEKAQPNAAEKEPNAAETEGADGAPAEIEEINGDVDDDEGAFYLTCCCALSDMLMEHAALPIRRMSQGQKPLVGCALRV